MAVKKPHKIAACLRCGGKIPDSMRSHAKYCRALCGTLFRNKIWQAANPEKMKRAIKEWAERNVDRCRSATRKSARKHQAKRVVSNKEWRRLNPDKARAASRRSYARNREKILAYMRERYGRNREEIIAKVIQWAKENPGKARARSMRYMASKLGATPMWLSRFDHQLISDIYDTAIESSRIIDFKLEVDHIVPLQGKTVCGLHVPWNLQIMAASQNRAKSNKHV